MPPGQEVIDRVRKTWRLLFFLIAVPVLVLLGIAAYWQVMLPDSFQMVKNGAITLPGSVKAVFREETLQSTGTGNNHERSADLVLMLGVSVKTVNVKMVDRETVLVSGKPFGIKMFTDGLMVVGMSDVTVDGTRRNPGKDAGIRVGDILISLDGITLASNEQFGELVTASQGRRMLLVFRRDGERQKTWIDPVQSAADGEYRIGIWVRDSSAGVGTVTYFDEKQNMFTGLGHAVCDVDTGDILSLSSGEAVEAAIIGCTPSSGGSPGELKGQFIASREFARLKANTACGIFGVLNNGWKVSGTEMPVALSHEIHTGEAVVWTTIDGSEPKGYDIVIEKILRGSTSSGQNMIIRIVDEELLDATGGIVQGMSGSPVIQDGMLAGAVTHVFVNEPQRGYAIFAENIRTMEESLLNSKQNAA